MKIVCNTTKFTEICLNIQRSIPSKAVLPHLECILIKTKENEEVELSGFDLDMGVYTSIGVDVIEEGAAVLNAKTFCDILRHLPDKTVTIYCNEKNVCTITSGDAEYTLVSLNPDEYPNLPHVDSDVPFRIQQSLLKDMIRRTIFAVSNDDSKSVHRGIKFEIKPGEIKLIALDGYRLAIRTEFIDYNGDPFSFIVPAKTLAEFIKLAEGDDCYTEILKDKRHIVFLADGYHLLSKLLEGEFLNYETALPKSRTSTVRVNTKQLIDCIERTSIIITEKIRSPIRCIFENDELKLSAFTVLGSSNDKMPVSIDGERTEIGFNNRFLTDALRSCDSDEVLIALNGPLSPALILPTEGESFMYLILPVRIKNEE